MDYDNFLKVSELQGWCVCVSLSPSFRHRGLSPGVLCHGICGQGWHNKGLGWPGLWRDERRERDNRELGNNKTEHEHPIWILWTQGGLEDKNDYPDVSRACQCQGNTALVTTVTRWPGHTRTGADLGSRPCLMSRMPPPSSVRHRMDKIAQQANYFRIESKLNRVWTRSSNQTSYLFK